MLGFKLMILGKGVKCLTTELPGWGANPGPNVIKKFVRNLRIFVKARVFVPDKPLQPSLMFTVKGQSLHKSITFQVPFSWVGSCSIAQTLD